MKKRRRWLLIGLIIFLGVERVALSQEVTSGETSAKGHPRIEHRLYEFALQSQQALFSPRTLSTHRGIKIDAEGMVTVFLLPEPGGRAIDQEALRRLGGVVIKTGDHVVKARVPIDRLEEIADQVPGIAFIKNPDKPRVNTISEGVSLSGATLFHSYGNLGEGVKVAVIDIGFWGLDEAIARGELPSAATRIDCTGAGCVSTSFRFEDDDHGTACAEIVYDMAPLADLYLIKVDDSLDLKDAKDYCVLHGVQIVSHSVAWFDQNYYDGQCYYDGVVCTADNAYDHGILWVNAAGNYATQHYAATFTDADGDGTHDEPICLQAAAGDVIEATLTWDVWPATNQDFDLILLGPASNEVDSSESNQTGTQPPVEDISYYVGVTGQYCFTVKKYRASSNPRIKLFSFEHGFLSPVPAGSIVNPVDAASVLSVAAIDWSNWENGPQEYFSSQGPTTDGRIKPDISGPDGTTSFTFGEPFFGTSASAPHVAGAAALVLSGFSSYTASDLRDALTSSATDIGPPGADTIYGAGKLDISTLAQPSGPDLTGQWLSSFTVSCTGSSTRLRCRLKGKLEIDNVGNLDALSSYVNVYLTDGTTNSLLKRFSTGKIKAGKAKVKSFSDSLDKGFDPRGKGYSVVAQIDADGTVAEINEGNNLATYGPIL